MVVVVVELVVGDDFGIGLSLWYKQRETERSMRSGRGKCLLLSFLISLIVIVIAHTLILITPVITCFSRHLWFDRDCGFPCLFSRKGICLTLDPESCLCKWCPYHATSFIVDRSRASIVTAGRSF